jgi:hypothetical protein
MISPGTEIAGKLGTCIFFMLCNFCIDKVLKYIDHGSSAYIYECVLKEKDIKMAVKIFSLIEASSIERDIQFGFDKRLNSEYTLIYEDKFESKPFQCVSMKLMKTSLKTIIDYLKSSRNFLSDDVY